MKRKFKKLNDIILTNYESDIVVRQGYEFVVFENKFEFEEWANEKEDIHEVILDERPCKVYFDIDINKDEAQYDTDDLTYGILETIKHMMKHNYDIDLEHNDIIFAERHRKEKWSYHIIIRNYYVERKEEIKKMLELEHTKNKYALWKYIDRQVYRSNSSLSISDGRYKGYQMKVRGHYRFSELLISHIPSSYKKLESRYSNTVAISTNIVISDDFMNKVVEQIRTIQDDDIKHYQIRDIKDNIIEFKRRTKGIHACSLCGGKHTSDNKLFITCYEENAVAYLHCRNTRNKRRIYKGNSILRLVEYIDIVKPNNETFKMDETQTSKIIKEYQVNDKMIIIKSPCGTGKTKRLIEYLKQFKKILIVSFRISLTNELSNKMSELGIKSYLDCDVKQKWNKRFNENEGYIEEKLIIQYESLYKIYDEMKYDIIVIDEMESVMDQMFSPTNKDKFSVNLITLNELIQNTSNVICLDAYISNRTINYLEHLDQEAYVIYNNYQAETENTYYITKSNDTIYKKINVALNENKRIVICSSCSKEALHGLYEALKNEYPEKRGKIYTSKSAKEMRVDLKDVEASWKGIDYLLYSPTIMAGVSFESENFDILFGLASNNSCGTKSFIQMLKRVRNIKEKKYYIGIQDIKLKYLETNKDQIIDDLERKIKHIAGDIQLSNFKKLNEDDKLKFNLYVDYIFERNKDIMYFLPRFIGYLKEYGAKMDIIDKNEMSKKEIDIKQIKEQIKRIRKDNVKYIVEAEDIDKEQMLLLREKREYITDKEQYQLSKYYLRHQYHYYQELNEKKVEFMSKKSNISIISNLKILKKYPTLKELQINEIHKIMCSNNPYDIISNSLYLKYNILDEIFKEFNYKFNFTRLEVEKTKELSTDDIKQRMKTYLTKEKQQEIRRIYQSNNIDVENVKSINTFINNVFKIFNFKMEFVRKKGIATKIYSIQFNKNFYIDDETGKTTIEL